MSRTKSSTIRSVREHQRRRADEPKVKVSLTSRSIDRYIAMAMDSALDAIRKSDHRDARARSVRTKHETLLFPVHVWQRVALWQETR